MSDIEIIRDGCILKIHEKGYTLTIKGKTRNIPSDAELQRLSEVGGTGRGAHAVRVYLGLRGGTIQDLIEGKTPDKIRYDIDRGRKIVRVSEPKAKSRGNGDKNHYVTREEILEAFKKTWPQEKVKRFKLGEKVTLPTIKEFTAREKRVSDSISKKRRGEIGLRRAVDEYIPGLYELVSKRISHKHVEINKLREEMVELAYSGVQLTQRSLERSDEQRNRLVLRKINRIVDNQILGKLTFNQVVDELIGKEKRQAIEGRNECAEIGERLAEFYAVWAMASGHDPLGISHLGIYNRKRNETGFVYGENKGGFADARIGEVAVEIKTPGGNLKSIPIKYDSATSYWDFGPNISGTIAFLFMNPNHYSPLLDKFKEKGIGVVGRDEFLEVLEDLTGHIRQNYISEISDVKPKVNLEYVVNTFLEVSDDRGISTLARRGMQYKRKYLSDMLKGLIEAGRVRINE